MKVDIWTVDYYGAIKHIKHGTAACCYPHHESFMLIKSDGKDENHMVALT